MRSVRLTAEDLKGALPDTRSTQSLDGLDSGVDVYRDAYGIPHVSARTAHDAFFAQGFATAQDRLWQMDHDRRVAYGRWAEFVGRPALDQDLTMRRFQIRASVLADYDAVNQETKAMLDAYAAGVNSYVDGCETLPVEYGLVGSEPERWRAWDGLAVFKARHILMGVFEAKLWRARLTDVLGAERAAELLPGYQNGHLLIVPPGEEYQGDPPDPLVGLATGADAKPWPGDTDAGSNNWALAGSRTASGKPLVAGDPHRSLEAPNVYYQNHISCPEFDAVGLSFPGLPGFPHFGHNAYAAWCVTHAAADYQDLYVERFKPGSQTLYQVEGEWSEADLRPERIEVRDAPAVEMDVVVTRHGPVISGDPASGNAIAFRYTATDGPNTGFDCLLRMLESRSAGDIEESMRDWVDACHNFVFADVHGDIGYLTRGRLPIRPMQNAWIPVPGWDGNSEWRGSVPFEELLRIRNPEDGLIVTANNKIVGDDYPHYIALDFTPEFRARRITERLETLTSATAKDMASVHAESVSIPGTVYKNALMEIIPLDDLSAEAIERLRGWEGEMSAGSVAAAIYSSFRWQLDHTLLRHVLGTLYDEAVAATGRGAPLHVRRLQAHFVEMARSNDPSMLPPGTDWPTVMARAMADSVAYLTERLGSDLDAWEWGKLHFTRPRHTLSALFPETADLLDPPSLPMSGDGDTPLSATYSMSDPFTVVTTSVARYVFDLDDWNNSAWTVPLGASGNAGSPHYADQAPIWGETKLTPMLYDWKLIEAQAESRQKLRKL